MSVVAAPDPLATEAVVPVDQINDLLVKGWEIVDRFETSQTFYGPPAEVRDAHGQLKWEAPPIGVGPVAFFRVRRKTDGDVVEALRTELETARGALAYSAADNESYRHTIVNLEKEIGEVRRQIDECRASESNARRLCVEFENLARERKVQLDYVMVEIGRERFEDIIAGVKESPLAKMARQALAWDLTRCPEPRVFLMRTALQAIASHGGPMADIAQIALDGEAGLASEEGKK